MVVVDDSDGGTDSSSKRNSNGDGMVIAGYERYGSTCTGINGLEGLQGPKDLLIQEPIGTYGSKTAATAAEVAANSVNTVIMQPSSANIVAQQVGLTAPVKSPAAPAVAAGGQGQHTTAWSNLGKGQEQQINSWPSLGKKPAQAATWLSEVLWSFSGF
jgi:hypothetical protein